MEREKASKEVSGEMSDKPKQNHRYRFDTHRNSLPPEVEKRINA